MTERDDDIEFDFFDEPETEEATQRRRLPRLERPGGGDGRGGRPPRPPLKTPAPGLIPLLRLVGLVAAVILAVLVLVLVLRGCANSGKQSSYQHYMQKVGTLASQSQQIGRSLTDKLTTPGVKQAELVSSIGGLAQQADQQVTEAQGIHPPGPLRAEHMHLIEALQLRASGLSRLRDAFARATAKSAGGSGDLLASQAALLTASDVDWDFFFRDSAVSKLKQQSVTGVAVPDSKFVQNPEILSSRTLVRVAQGLNAASTPTGGSSTGGVHGDALVSVVAQPQGLRLSPTSENTINATTSLAFEVSVKNSGSATEVSVPVTLTIQRRNSPPLVKRQTIPTIDAGQTTVVRFGDIGQPDFGFKTTLKADVGAVPNEANTQNNSASYTVYFSLAP